MAKEQKKEYKQNPNFPKVGAMILKKEKDIEEKDAYYIKFSDDVEVTVNGKKVTSLNVERPTTKYVRMLQAGKISDKEFEAKQEQYSATGEYNYIKFEFSADLRDPSEKKKQ